MRIEDSTVGTFAIGGDLEVRRLGFGAMRISGARDAGGVRDREEARRLVRAVVDNGVNLIDTADIYGYGESEEIIAEALHPYPADLVIATKAGYRPGKILKGHVTLPPSGHPDSIRAACESSLRRLRVDTIDLYQVHVPDPTIPYDETIGAFIELQRAGKVRHIGVSNVTLDQLTFARQLCRVVSVQNRYNAGDRDSDALVDACAADGIAFLPWAPIMVSSRRVGSIMSELASARQATVQQIALQWLLHRAPNILPIPGTSSVVHAEQNVAAAQIRLSASDLERIDEAAGA